MALPSMDATQPPQVVHPHHAMQGTRAKTFHTPPITTVKVAHPHGFEGNGSLQVYLVAQPSILFSTPFCKSHTTRQPKSRFHEPVRHKGWGGGILLLFATFEGKAKSMVGEVQGCSIKGSNIV